MSYTVTRPVTLPERAAPHTISRRLNGEATTAPELPAVPLVATLPAMTIPASEARASKAIPVADAAPLPELPELTARAAPGRVFLMPRPSVSDRPRAAAA